MSAATLAKVNFRSPATVTRLIPDCIPVLLSISKEQSNHYPEQNTPTTFPPISIRLKVTMSSNSITLTPQAERVPNGRVILYLFLCACFLIAMRINEISYYLLAVAAAACVITRNSSRLVIMLFSVFAINITNYIFFFRGFHFQLGSKVTPVLIFIFLLLQPTDKQQKKFTAPLYGFLGYLLYMLLTASASWNPTISTMKLVNFIPVFLGFMCTANIASRSKLDNTAIRAFLLALACFFILGSLASIPFPSISKSMLNYGIDEMAGASTDLDGLYNGLTYHSQALGVALGMLNSLLIVDYFINIRRRHWLYLMLLVSVPVLLFLSSSRTGMMSYLGSYAVFTFLFIFDKKIKTSSKMAYLTIIGGVGVLIFIATLSSAFHEKMTLFISKGGSQEQGLYDAYNTSRGNLIDIALDNFHDSPWIGNGFQVSSKMAYISADDARTMFAAPVEKGFFVTTILEEGGIIGLCIFVIFLINVYVYYFSRRFICFLTVFTTFLLTNVGEASIFSPSSIGGFGWMLCFLALIMDIQRLKREQAAAMAG